MKIGQTVNHITNKELRDLKITLFNGLNMTIWKVICSTQVCLGQEHKECRPE